MNAINVDNEYFFSDHIIVRKPNVLEDQEYKRAILCALPHEFNQIVKGKRKKKPKADRSDDDNDEEEESDSDYDQLDDNTKNRLRSKSLGDYENQKLQLKNMEDRWGKGIWEITNYESDRGLVGPLKIIKLPSGRSAAKSIHQVKSLHFNFNSALPSIRGSVDQSPMAGSIDDKQANAMYLNYINLQKKINTPLVPNLDNENLVSISNRPDSYHKSKKVTIGEENLNKLIKGTLTCRNSRKIKHPNNRHDYLLTKIDENTLSEGTQDAVRNKNTLHRKNKQPVVLFKNKRQNQPCNTSKSFHFIAA